MRTFLTLEIVQMKNKEAALWKAKSLRSKQRVLNLLMLHLMPEALPKMKFYRKCGYTLAK